MGREFELKFTATEQALRSVAERYGDFIRITMETTYFDTPEGTLSVRHITLRRRIENGESICTVKTPLSDGSRGEWEIRWSDPETMVQELIRAGAPATLQELTAQGIIPVCGARFQRMAKVLTTDGGTVELALDRGELLGGGKSIPLCELEVELKTGSDMAAISFADALAAEFQLLPQPVSKFRRAQLLAKGE